VYFIRIAFVSLALVLAALPVLAQPTAAPATPAAVPTMVPQLQLPAVPDVAPGYVAPPITAPPSQLIGVTQSPFVGLRLEDAIGMALMKNTDLAIAQENRKIAEFDIVAAHGAYDVQFQVVPSYSHQVQPPISAFAAGPGGGPTVQDTLGGNAAVTGTLEQTGTQFQFGASSQRVTSNSAVNSFNPYYLSALSVNVNQPLLRGFASDQARRQILLAQANQAATNAGTLLTASNVIVAVDDAYWDLVSAWRNVAIQNEGLRNALAQAQTTQRSATAGASAPIDVTESNSQVAVFQDNVLSALQNVQRLQNQIKVLILDNPSDPIWTANLVPTSNVGALPAEQSLDDVIVQAIHNRPEIAQVQAQRRGADVTLAYARDQLKPSVNLQLGYTTNGFAGQPTSIADNPIFTAFGSQISAINQLIARNNVLFPGTQISPLAPLNFGVPPYTAGGAGTGWANLWANRFPVYSAQVNVQFPIGNRVAKGNYGIAQEQAHSVDVQQVALVQRIKTESLNALQTLREARYRLTAARTAREASQAVFESEQRRFAAGTSTTFLVLQRQLDLANNQGRELQAQTDLNKAVVELQRVTGEVITRNGLDVGKLGTGALGDLSGSLQANPALPTPAPSR
jgi:outer membrane protein TolC